MTAMAVFFISLVFTLGRVELFRKNKFSGSIHDDGVSLK